MARDPYVNMAKKMFARKLVDKDLIVDQPALTRMKIAASRSNTQALVRGIESLVPEKETDALVTPYVGWTHATWEQDKKVAVDALTQADAQVTNLVNNPAIQSIFVTKNTIPGMLGTVIPTVPMSKDEIANAIRTAEEINKLDIPRADKVALYQKQTGVPLANADMQFNEITANGLAQTFGEAYNAQYEAEENLTRMNQVEASLLDTYYKNEGKDSLKNLKKSNGWENKSDTEAAALIKESLNYSNVWKDKSGTYYGTTTSGKKVTLDPTKGADLISNFTPVSFGSGRTTGGLGGGSSQYAVLNKAQADLKSAEKHIAKNPEYAKSTRSFDVRGGKDTQLSQYLGMVKERLNNPAEITGLIQELSGTADFQLRDAGGNKIAFSDIKPNSMDVDFVTKPTGGVLIIQGLAADGKSKVYQEFKIPETHKYVVDKAIMELGINGYETNDPVALETAANHWAMSNGAYKSIPTFKALEPSNKIPTNDVKFVVDASRPNETVEFRSYSKPLVYKPSDNPNRPSYNIHLVKSPTGGKAYVATVTVASGNGTKEVIVPFEGKSAGYAHNNLEDLTSNINKQEMPYNFKKQVVLEKLPKGTIINDRQTAALVTGIGAFNNMGGTESESFSIETEE